ncbi:hypothetical protein [Luteibacter yeojuensis]|uniref:Haem-binding uptake Tiki superfamily ChaN domain-containing protein n=1 Tax=Luteibacter yeojuensis TaxID=345309 RepID=A0A0F3KWV7_9GAMM|nr:hypothetical protein [Luteibacter yeojuensis]KJV35462.1 hypothetical protein VI08_07835 [Luteibacter yeojuensis]
MRATRWALTLLAGFSANAAHAACPDKPTLDTLTKMGSVFIGEEHGTNESPAFVRCVVEHDIASGMHPTVALEQSSTSRDLASDDWLGTDGRHSKAMAALVVWLLAREKAGAVKLHWLDDYTKSGDTRDHDMGESLVPLLAEGPVIAYAGNVHAQKSQRMMQGYDVKPAGEYAGAAMVHVLLAPSGPGSAWNCIGTCGVHTQKGGVFSAKPGTLVPAASLGRDFLLGYDYVYSIASFTASPPSRQATHTPATAPATPHP